MDTPTIWQVLALIVGATGVAGWAYARYGDAARKYPLFMDALKDFLGVARTYYQAKADGTYSTEDQIAMGIATIEFINALEAIGIDTGVSTRIMQITPLIPSDAAIKTIQDQIDQTIAATPAPITLAPGAVIVSTGSENLVREG